jgi:hypothetical protein
MKDLKDMTVEELVESTDSTQNELTALVQYAKVVAELASRLEEAERDANPESIADRLKRNGFAMPPGEERKHD